MEELNAIARAGGGAASGESARSNGTAVHSETALESPYDAPDLYDLLFEALEFDLRFWLDVARSAGGPVLDVGCGTGRVLLRLLEAGIDIDGVDAFPRMLARLSDKAADRGLTARVVAADMRDFTMPRRYARVICAFNAFAHCETIEDQLSALRCMREHLEHGGALVMHMSYPLASLWIEPSGEPVLEIESKHPINGNTLQLWDTRFKNAVGQCQRSQMEVKELDASGRVVDSQRFETTQRWIYRYEMELLLSLAGFSRWEIQGGFDGQPLERDDQQMIVWAWRD